LPQQNALLQWAYLQHAAGRGYEPQKVLWGTSKLKNARMQIQPFCICSYAFKAKPFGLFSY